MRLSFWGRSFSKCENLFDYLWFEKDPSSPEDFHQGAKPSLHAQPERLWHIGLLSVCWISDIGSHTDSMLNYCLNVLLLATASSLP